MDNYLSLRTVIEDCAEVFKPVRDISIADFAAEKLPNFNPEVTHLMAKPAECLRDNIHREVVVVAPARTGKTQMLIDNWILHGILNDPADMKVFCPDEKFARWFSKKRIDVELMGAVPELRSQIRPGAHNDNVYDKIFRNGVMLSIGWPSKSQLAGRDLTRVAFTDYDRGVESVGGEGSQFELGAKRTEAALSRAKVLAESSPGKAVYDPKWKPRSLHDAPPTTGILGLYRDGDRHRVYGKCPHCKEYFMPEAGPEALSIPAEGTNEERALAASLVCTNCGSEIDQTQEREFRRSGEWVGEGQTIHSDGTIEGEVRQTNRASFWMPGWFAGFQTWAGIALRYLRGLESYNETGDEEPLRVCYNTDMGAPYIEMGRRSDEDHATAMQDRKVPLERYQLPEWTRCVLASVDVQGGAKSRFEVLFLAVGEHRKQAVIDRKSIRLSARKLTNGEYDKLRPAQYVEDWRLIEQQVINTTYKLPNGREMRVLRAGVDTGGEDGVTNNAYAWYRELRERGLHQRVVLVKGMGPNPPYRTKVSYPDDKSNANGEIPVLLLNTNALKDAVWGDITRHDPGPGYVYYPQWLKDWFFQELCAEQRMPKGWERIGAKPNESFDLFVYIRGMWIDMGGDRVDWSNPPIWLRSWDLNPEVMAPQARREMQRSTQAAVAATPARPTRFRYRSR
ncbi:MAG: terminase gpA endonuclease subunit [Pseudomonadota bacterium]